MTTESREWTYLRRIVAKALEIPLRYLATQEATVVAQAADGTLEVKFDDPAMPPMSNLPIWLGLPGMRVEVSRGARVSIGHFGGDPRRRYAGLWATDAAFLKIVVDGGIRAVARKWDHTSIGQIQITNLPTGGGPPLGVMLTYQRAVAPGEAALPVIATILGPITVVPEPAIFDLAGIITDGNEKVTA